jgi:hypothetical protein
MGLPAGHNIDFSPVTGQAVIDETAAAQVPAGRAVGAGFGRW